MADRDARDNVDEMDPSIGRSLHEAEARFHALVESFPDAVMLVGSDKRISLANARAERLLGFQPGELSSRPIETLMPEEGRRNCLERYDEFFADEGVPSMTVLDNVSGRRADGGVFPAQFVLTPFRTGDAMYVTTIVRDATERKLSEQVIRESVELVEAKEELEYKSTLLESQNEASVDGILIVDPEGHVVSYNQRFIEMWGIDPALVDIGASDEFALASVLNDLADPQGFLDRVEDLVANPEASLRDELTFKDGRVFERWSTPISSETGVYYGRGWYFRDITERVRAEERIRRQEQWFRRVTRYSGDAISVLDAEGNRTYVSASAEFLSGHAASDLVGRSVFEHVHPDDVDRVQADLGRAMTDPGMPHKVEYRLRHRDGHYVDVESVSVNMLEDPAVRGIIVNTRDITDRKAAEDALKQAYEQLKEHEKFRLLFLNNVSHDLGGSLTPVKIQARLLGSEHIGELNDQQQKALELLDKSIDHITLLVQDLKDVARLEAGHLKVRPETIDLGGIVHDAVEPFRGAADEKGVDLRLDLADEVEVHVDGARIRQVLTNLVTNALKFTSRGDQVIVRVQRRDDEVVVSAIDTGEGLTQEQMARLFRPFSQVHEPHGSEHRGTGLGLYICKGIIAQHDGRIWCASEGPGKGATFAFSLPLARRAPGSGGNLD